MPLINTQSNHSSSGGRNASLSLPMPNTPTRRPSMSPALQGIPSLSSSKLPSPKSKSESKDQDISAEEAFNLEDKQYAYDVHEFELKLRRARHYGSSECAKDTCHLLRLIIHKG